MLHCEHKTLTYSQLVLIDEQARIMAGTACDFKSEKIYIPGIIEPRLPSRALYLME